MFCPDCEIYMNGIGQWRDHIRSYKHRVNQQPLLTVADAEARAAKTWRLWADWEKRRQEARGGGASLRAELEVQRGRTQGVAVAVSAAQQDFAVAVALKQHGLADEEAVREARARARAAESRQQHQDDLAAARLWLERALVEREKALVERKAWRQKAKDNAKAAAEAQARARAATAAAAEAQAGARAQAAAALKAAAGAGPIVVD